MMEELQFANSDSLIPLYIGITGHRDIFEKDQTRLKSMIRDFIESKKKKCPHTPVVVLTPLAEGADRLAATAAIESGTDFIAALPMPRDSISGVLPQRNQYLNLISSWRRLRK